MGDLFSHAGFTFTNEKLQLAEIVLEKNHFNISRIDEIYFNEEIDFLNDKGTKISALLRAAFEELSIKKTIASNAVSFSLPQELFITSRLPIEQSLLHSDLVAEFQWRLSVMYPFLNWNDYLIRYFEPEFKSNEIDNSAIVFSINRRYIKIIHDFCGKNNLKLKFIDHCHLAANNLLTLNSSSKGSAILSLYLSQKILSILIAIDSKPVYYQDVPIKSLQDIPNIVMEKLIELSSQKLEFTDAALFGDSVSTTVVKVLSESTGIKFRLVNPFSQFKAEPHLLTHKYFTESNHFFAPSAGAALRI